MLLKNLYLQSDRFCSDPFTTLNTLEVERGVGVIFTGIVTPYLTPNKDVKTGSISTLYKIYRPTE